MGKSKKAKHNRPNQRPYIKPHHSQQSKPKPTIPQQQPHKQKFQQAPTVPFEPTDRILLVGEGDFSFAHSLYTNHNCCSLLATCYDSVSVLKEKYPQSTTYIQELEAAAKDDEDVDVKVLYGVDATKLGRSGAGGGGKEVRSGGFDRVVFNFPHVGGLTKDVNRQVRYNQGTIVVTIFEGDPYSLWNIRDLARHVGLKVGRSFKFQAEAYPGYKHARTLGNIDGGGGWKGEKRDARTYIFERKDEDATQAHSTRKKRKNESSDSDDDD
ncbi:MAG: hypothetical protein Q9181_000059 [Wetmoreana brouardii]